MSPVSPELIITDIGFIAAALGSLGAGIFVLYKSAKKPLNRVFFLYAITAAIFFLSHVIGINIPDPELSRRVFLFNMSTILGSVLTAHWVLALVGRDKSQKKILIAFYALAFIIICFFLTFPDGFLKPSRPILYFPNYYVQGEYYYLGDLFFYLVVIYFFSHAISAYIKADIVLRKRIRYVFTGILCGYALGLLPALPLYGYDFDPILSSLTGLYIIPLIYGLVKEELMDVHVIAKQAFGYTVLIGGIGITIAGLNYLNVYLVLNTPDFPSWIVPFLSGIIAVGIASLVWKKLKQNEELKYEFITVITHKFRTPLTYLKWSIESLRKAPSAEEREDALKNMEHAEQRLYELTDVLIDSAQSENREHSYKLTPVNISRLMGKIINETLSDAQSKKVDIRFNTDWSAKVLADENKIAYALQAVLGNAIAYTPEHGTVLVSIVSFARKIRITVRDSGIGIAKENIIHIFDKFYRTHQARLEDTEGLGIGLFITKNIIERQSGRIWAESEGVGKGTTFTIELVRAR